MLKISVVIMVIFWSFQSYSSLGELNGCGQYEISGTVRKDSKSVLKVLIHEGTKSEYTILISSNELASISGFIDRDVQFVGEIDEVDGTKLHATNLSDFKNRITNPLNLNMSTGFKLLKGKGCKK